MSRVSSTPVYRVSKPPIGFYTVLCVLSCVCAWLGVTSETPWLAYQVPGFLAFVTGTLSFYRFFILKQGLDEFILFGGSFVFFHALPLNPVTWPEFQITLRKYSQTAQLHSTIWSALFPVLCFFAVRLWGQMFPQKRDWSKFQLVGATKDRFEGQVFLWFLLIFVAVAIPNFVSGRIIMRSISQIIHMRATEADMEDMSFQVTGGGFELGSFYHLSQMAPSLFLLSIVLFQTRYRIAILLLSPLTTIWTLGYVFQGTRTYTVMFMLACAVIFFSSPRTSTKSLLGAISIMAVTIMLCQVMMIFRGTGLGEFDWETYASKFFNIGGNEMLTDQMRATEFFMQGYSDDAIGGIALIDMARGIFFKGYEMLVYFIPRSVFPDKPIDTSMYLFNIFTFSFEQGVRMGEADPQAGISAGILGREILRWGYLGPLGAVFWFSLFVFAAHRSYEVGKWNMILRVVPGAIAGTCYISYRDLIPLFFTPLLPAAFVVWFAARGVGKTLPLLKRPSFTAPAARGQGRRLQPRHG